MPKIIPNVREKILDYTKTALIHGDSADLTVGKIAQACQIATGTVFNYFPSKDEIFATILLEDWRELLADMTIRCSEVTNLGEGVTIIYEGIKTFCKRYEKAWTNYRSNASVHFTMRERHVMLRAQIIEILSLVPTLKELEEAKLTILAEEVLLFAQDETLDFTIWKQALLTLLK